MALLKSCPWNHSSIFISIPFYTSICWCNPSSHWNNKIVCNFFDMPGICWIIFNSDNIPRNACGVPLLGLAKSIYYVFAFGCLPKCYLWGSTPYIPVSHSYAKSSLFAEVRNKTCCFILSVIKINGKRKNKWIVCFLILDHVIFFSELIRQTVHSDTRDLKLKERILT